MTRVDLYLTPYTNSDSFVPHPTVNLLMGGDDNLGETSGAGRIDRGVGGAPAGPLLSRAAESRETVGTVPDEDQELHHLVLPPSGGKRSLVSRSGTKMNGEAAEPAGTTEAELADIKRMLRELVASQREGRHRGWDPGDASSHFTSTSPDLSPDLSDEEIKRCCCVGADGGHSRGSGLRTGTGDHAGGRPARSHSPRGQQGRMNYAEDMEENNSCIDIEDTDRAIDPDAVQSYTLLGLCVRGGTGARGSADRELELTTLVGRGRDREPIGLMEDIPVVLGSSSSTASVRDLNRPVDLEG